MLKNKIILKTSFVKLLVYSNIYVAVAVACITLTTGLMFSISVINECLFSFFGTLFIYNIARLIKHKKLNNLKSPRYFFIKSYYKHLLLLSVLSFFCSLYYLFKFPYNSFYLLFPCSVVAFFYSIPVINIRGVPGLKLFLIAFIWTVLTFVIPIINTSIYLDADFYLQTLQRFLFIMAITIPFDIRDLSIDKKTIKTLPMLIGVQKSKWIAIGLLAIAEILLLIQFFTSDIFTLIQVISLYFCYEVMAVLIYFSDEQKGDMYYSFVIESTLIFMFVLYFAATIF